MNLRPLFFTCLVSAFVTMVIIYALVGFFAG